MAETPAQNFSNHAHQPRQTAIAGLFTLVAFVVSVVATVREPSLSNLAILSLSFGVMMLVAMSRTYTVRLQDRIIRLEMRLRLERLGRAGDFGRLAHPQLVALRFASDDELPELLDRALSERLSAKQIKESVRDWQADWFRT